MVATIAAVTRLAGRRTARSPVAYQADQPLWVVDVGLATRYPQIGLAIRDAGAEVLAFDFPGAALPNGNRYVWARDYGPLAMPPAAERSTVWDARSGGSATQELDERALPLLAAKLGVRHRALDIAVQGGNWMPLPDGRVITSSRFFHDNRALGSRAEIEARLQSAGVRGLLEVAPMPGELTQHADMVLAVDPATGRVFVGELWPAAVDLIPPEPGWDMYREMARSMGESLDRTALALREELGEERIFRFPQPLPHLDRHPTEERYRPSFPSFVNGIFVVAAGGRTTYLYGLARGAGAGDYYAFDTTLVDDYVAQVETVARALGFTALGVETGDLVRNGGSIHCATVECPFDRRRAAAR